MSARPSYLITMAMAVCCCSQCLTSNGQSASGSLRNQAGEQQQPIHPADEQVVGTGISVTDPEAIELKGWEPSSKQHSASVMEQSLKQSEPNRRPTDVLLVARRETNRNFPNATGAHVREAADRPFPSSEMKHTNPQSRNSFDPQQLEPIELYLIDDEPGSGVDSNDANDTTSTPGVADRRAGFRESLLRPLPTDPVQLALEYVDDDGNPVPDSEFRHSVLIQFAGFNSRPFGDGDCRFDAYECCWHAKYYVWKSPDLCYGPLYFEEVNLERFGGRFPIMQPAISAVQFVGNTIRLPYSMGLQSPHHCYYSAGYGRPGNQYCYQYERPVWSLKGGTLQALLITGVVFGLP